MKKLVIVIWGFLSSCCVYAYCEQDRLISRGSYNIKWRQSENNDNGCSPSYNYFCPYHESNNSSCDRAHFDILKLSPQMNKKKGDIRSRPHCDLFALHRGITYSIV